MENADTGRSIQCHPNGVQSRTGSGALLTTCQFTTEHAEDVLPCVVIVTNGAHHQRACGAFGCVTVQPGTLSTRDGAINKKYFLWIN